MKLIKAKWAWLTLAGILCVELASIASFIWPVTEPWLFGILTLATFGISLYKLRIGVGIILAELLIGSKGHLLDITLFDQSVSLRMGFFAALLLASVVWIIKSKRVRFAHARTQHLFTLLFFALGLGLALAFIYGNPNNLIYLDGNGYLFFLLIIPFYQAIKSFIDIKILLSMMIGALIAGLMKTGLLLLAFSHQIPYLTEIYHWTRDTGIGEITALEGSYRIFFQSHIFTLIFIALIFVIFTVMWRSKFTFTQGKPFFILLSACTAAVILSGSRSLWVALICVAIAFFFTFLFFLKTPTTIWKRLGGIALFAIAGGFAWIWGITQMPMPGVETLEFSTGSLISERTTGTGSDAASGSRFALLHPLFDAALRHPVFGSGFGSTVTYTTQDQRFIDVHGHNQATTYAFEWGYLDIIYKTGIVGLVGWAIVFLGLGTFIILLVKNERKPSRQIILLMTGLGLITIFGIHLTTPYLNHPLGIGWLLFSAASIEAIIKEHA